MSKSEFGGPWTLIKLDVLKKYLNFYTTVLKNTKFKTYYFDAFAGSGDCHIKDKNGDLQKIEGSATIAVTKLKNEFQFIHLIEKNEEYVKELSNLVGSKSIVRVHNNDANIKMQNLIDSINWKESRGVAFLDPYGLQLEWTTLEKIAKTKAIDVWYLFPIGGLNRLIPKEQEKSKEINNELVDRVLGTKEWRDLFYKTTDQSSFILDKNDNKKKALNTSEIGEYLKNRLETIYKGWVSDPIILTSSSSSPLFYLFFAGSNTNPNAVEIYKKGVIHLKNMHKDHKLGLTLLNEKDTPQKNLFSEN